MIQIYISSPSVQQTVKQRSTTVVAIADGAFVVVLNVRKEGSANEDHARSQLYDGRF